MGDRRNNPPISDAGGVSVTRIPVELILEKLAKAGVSRVASGKIERGDVVPRARTLDVFAKALEVPVGELVTPVRPLGSVRFRTRTRVHASITRSHPSAHRSRGQAGDDPENLVRRHPLSDPSFASRLRSLTVLSVVTPSSGCPQGRLYNRNRTYRPVRQNRFRQCGRSLYTGIQDWMRGASPPRPTIALVMTPFTLRRDSPSSAITSNSKGATISSIHL